MAEWSISPSDASINSSGVASFPSNTGSVAKLYTVTYTDDNGCTGKTTYTVPACPPPDPPQPVDCNAYGFVDKSPTQPVAGNTSMVVATSSKSKGQLTVGSKDSWITYVTTDSDSSTYQYKFKAASNTGGSYREGSVTFTSSDGCEFTAHMYQNGRTCQCSDIESGIVYKNTFLPTSAQNNLLLFSADTQGCGSISAYCSSSEDSIFESDGDNLVKVVEVEANKKYEVRANVLNLPSRNPGRSCVVNIHVKRADGTLCKTIAKDFIQDPNINCSKFYNYISYNHSRAESGEVLIAEGSVRQEYNSQLVEILEFIPQFTPVTWISDDSSFKYVFEDNKWKVYATISENQNIANRESNYKTLKYILDTPAIGGTRYTPSQLKSMSTTQCGEGSNVNVVQYGCNCNVPGQVYGGTSYRADREGDITSDVYVRGTEIETACTRLTAATKVDTCNWISNVSVSDNRYLHYTIAKNNKPEERKCTIKLKFTDFNRDNCEKDYEITQQAGEVQVNCRSCDSIIDDGILNVYPTIWDSTDTNTLMFIYSRKLEEDCDGTVTFTPSTVGVTNPMTGFMEDRRNRYGDTAYCYFKFNANTSTEEKHAKLTFSYRNSSVNCSKVYDITQKGSSPTPTTKCTSRSYDYNFVYITGDKGKTLNNPIVFSAGERLKIGSLSNSIPSSATSCCGIEAVTTQTDVFGVIKVEPKSGGGYDIYATALTGVAAQDATIDISWWYEDSSGNKYYPNTTNVYVRNRG
jgi:hypothetical protein